MPHPPDPVRRLPRAVEVHAHIGQLLLELRLARRLFKLSRAVETVCKDTTDSNKLTAAPRQGVAGG